MKHFKTLVLFAVVLFMTIQVKPVFAADPTQTTEPTQEQPVVEPVLPAVTDEPLGSDLVLLHAETILDSNRWIQSFAYDGTYYYFVQMTNPYKGNLRITRVYYESPTVYYKDHMDLVGWGHGTNIDCSVYKGKTYLWLGSCADKSLDTTAISSFEYKPNMIYNKKAGNTYKIRMKGRLKKATNVFPAVSASGKYLYVRYTYKNKQCFQKYKIYHGNAIKTYLILGKTEIPLTSGDFQGFDCTDSTIYTIEGSPSAAFLASYDKTRVYQPTVVRQIHFKKKTNTARIIWGASTMAFREPEGIKIYKNGKKEMMFLSNTLSFQKCNIYQIK